MDAMSPRAGRDILGVVSPHLDDALLSCALHLASHPGSQVVTVFAGGPATVAPLTAWDAATGRFRDGDDVMAVRRAEDAAAARLVGAQVHHLGFWDEQYRCRTYDDGASETRAPSPRAIATSLAALARRLSVTAWLVPLGIGHEDHRLAAAGALRFVQRDAGSCRWYCYYELPYYAEHPVEATAAVAALERRGFRVGADDELAHSRNRARKLAALSRYGSQRALLGRRLAACVWHEERVVALERPVASAAAP